MLFPVAGSNFHRVQFKTWKFKGNTKKCVFRLRNSLFPVQSVEQFPELWGRTNHFWDTLRASGFHWKNSLAQFFVVAHSCVTVLMLILNKGLDRVLRSKVRVAHRVPSDVARNNQRLLCLASLPALHN